MPIDFDFIQKLEGFDPQGLANVPRDSSGNALGQSGVTLPGGIDLGQQDLAGLTAAGLTTSELGPLQPFMGLRGKAAITKLAQSPLQVSPEFATKLSQQVMNRDVARLEKQFNLASNQKFSDLPDSFQTVLTSVHHQFGNLASETPNFWKQVTSGKFDDALKNLRNFGDDFPTRRNKEADLFQQGIIENFLRGQQP